MTNYLFIGGTNDGRREPIPDEHMHVQMLCEPRPVISDKLGIVAEPTEIYVKQSLHGESRVFPFFVIEGMSADDMIERLLAKYPDSAA